MLCEEDDAMKQMAEFMKVYVEHTKLGLKYVG